MKTNKIIYLIAGCIFFQLFCGSIVAQVLVQEGTQWNIRSLSFTGPATSFSLKMEGNEVIDNLTYKKIYRTNNTSNQDWSFTGQYIREDATKKVYFKNGLNAEEELIYDFDLNLGDTFIISSFCSPDQNEIVVTNIDFITLNNGEERKRLKVEKVNNPTNYFLPDYWIEGIGTHKGNVINPLRLFCGTDYLDDLLCFYENEELLYPENPNICFITTNTEALVTSSPISVFPNPFYEFLSIETADDGASLEQITLYTLKGKPVIQIQATKNTQQINLSDLPKGIYFLRLTTKEGYALSRKLIKH